MTVPSSVSLEMKLVLSFRIMHVGSVGVVGDAVGDIAVVPWPVGCTTNKVDGLRSMLNGFFVSQMGRGTV